MINRILFSIIFSLFLINPLYAFCEELNLKKGKVYLLNFDENIENINFDKNKSDIQILYTISGVNNQIICSLKNAENSFLQVKTKNNYNDLKTLLIQDVSPFIVSETGRKPLILPVFLEIKK